MSGQSDSSTHDQFIAAMSRLFISVVIPVHDGAKTIAVCLESLPASDYSRYEVIVVDDASGDDTVKIVRGFPCRLIEMTENRGPGAARNAGAGTARGDILFFLDSDITITPSTLSSIVASFADRPDISALFCSYQKQTIPWNFFTQYKNLVHHHTHQGSREDAVTFCGGFGAIHRDVFRVIGGFSEDYLFLEDIELGYRLHQGGHKIFLNKSIQLTHHKKYSFWGLVKSDLFGRAVPWTRIMLQKRIVRNDLNTRVHNTLSVVVAIALLTTPAIALAWPVGLAAVISLSLISLLLVLNYPFLKFVCGEAGWFFTVQSIGMLWFSYVYSGFGLLLGIVGFLGECRSSGKPEARGIAATYENPVHH